MNATPLKTLRIAYLGCWSESSQSGSTAVKLISINCCGNANRVTWALVLVH